MTVILIKKSSDMQKNKNKKHFQMLQHDVTFEMLQLA